MMAENRLMPYMPRFETELTPPSYCSGLSLCSRARSASRLTSSEISKTDFFSAFFIIGEIKPPGIATATPIFEA